MPVRYRQATVAGKMQGVASPAFLPGVCRAVLGKGASFRFRAGGSSMWPFIRHGDVLFIAPLQGKHPRLGEVVAYVRADTGAMTVHRIVARRNGYFLIKGDNIEKPDGLVPRGDIMGVVSKIEREGRTLRPGMGPERVFIALLSRTGVFHPLITAASRIRGIFRG